MLADAKKLITQAARRDIVTRGHNGSGQPVLTTDEIVINGDFSAGLSCENLFLRPPKPNREPYAHWFVKTQGHPYDEVVTAILVSARLHTGARFNPDNQGLSSRHLIAGLALYEDACGPMTLKDLKSIERMWSSACVAPHDPARPPWLGISPNAASSSWLWATVSRRTCSRSILS